MRQENLHRDKILKSSIEVVEGCAEAQNYEVVSIILYGSKARGDKNSQSEYELLVLLDDSITLKDYIKYCDTLKLKLIKKKLCSVKILVYTPSIFKDIFYTDNFVGTFLYAIYKDSIVLYDKLDIFVKLREQLTKNALKNEVHFLEQCIDFAKEMGSVKWEQKWERLLMQHKYLKTRRE